jgi:hypothetical protein
MQNASTRLHSFILEQENTLHQASSKFTAASSSKSFRRFYSNGLCKRRHVSIYLIIIIVCQAEMLLFTISCYKKRHSSNVQSVLLASALACWSSCLKRGTKCSRQHNSYLRKQQNSFANALTVLRNYYVQSYCNVLLLRL